MICGHEFRPLHSFPSSRSNPLADALSSCCTLRCGDEGSALWVSAATHLHGVRAVDVAGGIARHRDVLQRPTRDALSSGIWQAGGRVDAGRRQRGAGLAALGGPCQGADPQSAMSLRGRRSWAGFGEHSLRAGFDDNRSVADALSVGRLPQDQGRHQAAYPDRSAWTHTDLHSYHWSARPRCSLARRSGLRARGLLRDGSWIHGLRPTPSDRLLRGVFRHSCQGQPALCPAILPARGSKHRPAQRPNRQAQAARSPGSLSRAASQGALLRRGDRPRSGFSDQSPQGSGIDRGPHLPDALADRTLLPLDQRASAHQALLRDEPQRRENSDLDRRVRLPDGGHPSQAAQPARKAPQNFAAFKCPPLRESAYP